MKLIVAVIEQFKNYREQGNCESGSVPGNILH
jgi:hypothetical protein